MSWPLKWGSRTHIMAIINVTPNSFSGDGLTIEEDMLSAVVRKGREAAADGAHVLDVGGVASYPGAPPVTEETEHDRVLPVIKALVSEVGLPISIDSYRPGVVAAALDAGATIVNSYWGMHTPEGSWNASLAALVAERRAPIILAHNRKARAVVGDIGPYVADAHYDNLLRDIQDDLNASVDYAIRHRITRDQLVLDPGLGQGKTPEQNLLILRHLDSFRAMGLPLMIGASRKSFIGYVLGGPPQARDGGTAAITAIAAYCRVDIVRVHNVRLNVEAARMVDALVR